MTSTPHKWNTSTHRKDPTTWKTTRAYIGERDGWKCQEFMRDGTPCTDKGTECDHIIPLSRGGTDAYDNLRMLCVWHHGRKSSAEGNDARVNLREARPKSKHPGLL